MKRIIIFILLTFGCISFCSAQDLVRKMKDSQYGYVDRLGDWVIQPAYTKAGTFSEGCAIVAVKKRKVFKAITKAITNVLTVGVTVGVNAPTDEELHSTKYGIIDVNGNTVISFSASSMTKTLVSH